MCDLDIRLRNGLLGFHPMSVIYGCDRKGKVDTLIVVSNDKLLQIVPPNTPVQDAFLVADDILRQGVVGISEVCC